MMKRFTLLMAAFLSMVTLCEVAGQQRIVFSQYMFNGMTINPAYAGSDDFLNVSLQARRQWVGFNGAPENQLLTVHAPIRNKNVGLGFLAERQSMGVTDIYTVFGMYAYQVRLGYKKTLSFGLQGGAISYDQRLSRLNTPQTVSDPNFSEDVSFFLPNFGTGLYLKTPNYYIGVSVPYLLESSERNEENVAIVEQNRHYFLSGGYLFDLSPGLKLKPNFMIQVVSGIPINANFNLNALIQEFLWVGVSYRLNQTFTSLIEVLIDNQLSFGFAYDFSLSNLKEITSGSPEIVLTYRFIKDVPKRVVSPRYF